MVCVAAGSCVAHRQPEAGADGLSIWDGMLDFLGRQLFEPCPLHGHQRHQPAGYVYGLTFTAHLPYPIGLRQLAWPLLTVSSIRPIDSPSQYLNQSVEWLPFILLYLN